MALLLSRTHLHGENNSPQSSKAGSTATVLIISHITFGDCHVHIFSDNHSRNSCIWYFHHVVALAQRGGMLPIKSFKFRGSDEPFPEFSAGHFQ